MQLGPRGASSGACGSPDMAFVAVVAGASALAPAPTKADAHPTVKTNRPALVRSATTFDLLMFVIGLNSRRRTPDAQKCGPQLGNTVEAVWHGHR